MQSLRACNASSSISSQPASRGMPWGHVVAWSYVLNGSTITTSLLLRSFCKKSGCAYLLVWVGGLVVPYNPQSSQYLAWFLRLKKNTWISSPKTKQHEWKLQHNQIFTQKVLLPYFQENMFCPWNLSILLHSEKLHVRMSKYEVWTLHDSATPIGALLHLPETLQKRRMDSNL